VLLQRNSSRNRAFSFTRAQEPKKKTLHCQCEWKDNYKSFATKYGCDWDGGGEGHIAPAGPSSFSKPYRIN
jgi:hypothetical protein